MRRMMCVWVGEAEGSDTTRGLLPGKGWGKRERERETEENMTRFRNLDLAGAAAAREEGGKKVALGEIGDKGKSGQRGYFSSTLKSPRHLIETTPLPPSAI